MSSYPTQQEVDFMVEWWERMNGLGMSAGFMDSDSVVKALYEKAESDRANEWQRIFGENSPWRADVHGKTLKASWDNNKAVRLGVKKN